MNNGMDKGSVYQEESYSGATFYSLNKKMDRKSFNLIIQNPKRDSSLEGHIKIIVHSPNSLKPNLDMCLQLPFILMAMILQKK